MKLKKYINIILYVTLCSSMSIAFCEGNNTKRTQDISGLHEIGLTVAKKTHLLFCFLFKKTKGKLKIIKLDTMSMF